MKPWTWWSVTLAAGVLVTSGLVACTAQTTPPADPQPTPTAADVPNQPAPSHEPSPAPSSTYVDRSALNIYQATCDDWDALGAQSTLDQHLYAFQLLDHVRTFPHLYPDPAYPPVDAPPPGDRLVIDFALDVDQECAAVADRDSPAASGLLEIAGKVYWAHPKYQP